MFRSVFSVAGRCLCAFSDEVLLLFIAHTEAGSVAWWGGVNNENTNNASVASETFGSFCDGADGENKGIVNMENENKIEVGYSGECVMFEFEFRDCVENEKNEKKIEVDSASPSAPKCSSTSSLFVAHNCRSATICGYTGKRRADTRRGAVRKNRVQQDRECRKRERLRKPVGSKMELACSSTSSPGHLWLIIVGVRRFVATRVHR